MSDNIYPSSTELTEHYTIFTLAFKHSLFTTPVNDWYDFISAQSWRPHDFLRGQGARSGIKEESIPGVTPFLPHNIFTNNGMKMTFGFKSPSKSILSDKEIATQTVETIIKQNKRKKAHLKENLILTLDPNNTNFINQELKIKLDLNSHLIATFKIDWVDTWLFNDQTGLLSFKVKIAEVFDGDESISVSIQHLNMLNRQLRFIYPSQLSVASNNGEKYNFWNDVIAKNWLLLNKGNEFSLLGDSLSADDFFTSSVDKNTRYTKMLVMAEIPELKDEQVEYLWNAPVIDPPLNFESFYDDVKQNNWSEIFSVYHKATIEGYPTKGDYALYDLATCGDVGAAAGLTGDKGWQTSPEYIKGLFENNSIEIWEYWRGINVKDTLAFLSYSNNMPITFQAESYYYPLYIYYYHLQFKLNCFSEDIIDKTLTDVLKARKLKDDFIQFRNSYWFQSVTNDFQGVEISNKIKHSLALDELFETVSTEVSEVSDFIYEKLEKGKQSLIAFAILAFYPISYLFERLNISGIFERFSTDNPVVLTLALAASIIFIGIICTKYLSRINELSHKVLNWFYRTFQ